MKRRCGRPLQSERSRVAAEALAAIRYLRDRADGVPPTRKALAAAIGVSSIATVVERLGVLRKAGLVRFEEGVGRSLRLTAEGEAVAVAEPFYFDEADEGWSLGASAADGVIAVDRVRREATVQHPQGGSVVVDATGWEVVTADGRVWQI